MKKESGKRMVKILENKGWYVDRIKGSHYIMKNIKYTNRYKQELIKWKTYQKKQSYNLSSNTKAN